MTLQRNTSLVLLIDCLKSSESVPLKECIRGSLAVLAFQPQCWGCVGSRAWPCCALQGEFLWLFGVKPSLPYRPAAALKGFVRVVGQDIALLAEIRRGRPQMGWLLGTLCLIS